MKYVVACKVPSYIVQVIENGYKRVTGRDLPTNNLHVSLIYPFFIYPTHSTEWVLNKIERLNLESIGSRLAKVDVFEQKNKILYISLEPYKKYYDNHLKVNRVLRSGIQIDTKPFLRGELPPYKPHIGIDYDFEGDYLIMHSLRLEGIEGWFDSGRPRLFRFDKKKFTEVLE